MVFGRPELDVSFGDHVRTARSAQLGHGKGAGQEFHETEIALEDRGRARQAFGGQQGGKDAIAGGVGEGAAFPHAQLPGARLPQGGVGHAGQADGMGGADRIEAEQLAGGSAGGDGPISDVVEAVLAQAGGVAEAALDFVGQHGGGDEVGAAAAGQLAHRENGGQVIAGMGRLQ